MALTEDQINQIEFQKAQYEANAAADKFRHRLELMRMAKEMVLENDRNKAVGERGISSDDITAEVAKLEAFLNS